MKLFDKFIQENEYNILLYLEHANNSFLTPFSSEHKIDYIRSMNDTGVLASVKIVNIVTNNYSIYPVSISHYFKYKINLRKEKIEKIKQKINNVTI